MTTVPPSAPPSETPLPVASSPIASSPVEALPTETLPTEPLPTEPSPRETFAVTAPWPLTDTTLVWRVVEGPVEGYFERYGPDGQVERREHLARCETGDWLWVPEAETGCQLWVSGTEGSRIEAVPRDRIWAEDADDGEKTPSAVSPVSPEALLRAERWVAALSRALKHTLAARTRPDVMLPPDDRFFLSTGRCGGQETPGVWVRLLSGEAEFMGRNDVSIQGCALTPEGPAFPLMAGSFIVARSDAELEIRTPAALAENGELPAAVARFTAVAYDLLSRALSGRAKEETTRFLQRRHVTDRLMAEALEKLAPTQGEKLAPTGGPTPSDAPDPSESERSMSTVALPSISVEALVNACRRVAQSLSADIKTPPYRALAALSSPLRLVERLAEASELRIRHITLETGWWRQETGPMVCFHTETGTPLALLPREGGGYQGIDPTTGRAGPVTREMAATIHPSAVLFYRTLPDAAVTPWTLFRFAATVNRGDLLTLFLVGSAAGLMAMAIPLATTVVFDHIVPGHQRAGLWEVGAALVMAALLLLIFQMSQGVAMLRIETRTTEQLQAAVMDRVLRLPVKFFRDFTSGDLGQRAMLVEQISRILTGSVLSSLFGGLFSLYTFALLFYYDSRTAMVALGLSLFLAVATGLTAWASIQALAREEEGHGRLTGLAMELVNGITGIRLAGAEARMFARWADRFTDMRQHARRADRIAGWFGAFNTGYRLFALAVVFLSIALVRDEAMTTGLFLAFVAAFTTAFMALSQMAAALADLFRIIPLYNRARPLLETLPETRLTAAETGRLSGHVEITGVTFRYNPDQPPVLSNVTIKAEPGAFIALVGSSGSGKSTLIRLLLGFETPETGEIFYDGQALSGLDLHQLRRQIGTVLQDTSVLTGSIFEIIQGAGNLEPEQAWEAARLASLDQDIAALPMGMHTPLADGTPALSGGQAQRLLIARALAGQPALLLLDEATSALDNRTQAEIAENLASLSVTRIVVAHRLSTVIAADRIYVLEKGRLVETGNYDSLMRRDGRFAELARRQLE